MRKLMVLSVAILATLAGTSVWAGCPSGTIAQGVDQNNNPICVVANVGNGGGTGTGTGNIPSGGGFSAVQSGGSFKQAIPEQEYMDQCMTHLTDLATTQLRAQLYKDKAVTGQVRAAARIDKNKLEPSCVKACKNFAYVSHTISWGHTVYIADSASTIQTKKLMQNLPTPAMPDKAELAACLPPFIIPNWCPASGLGVGAGPSRIENPLDKIKVCISGNDALKYMNFTDADAAHNCSRPSIVNADERITAEQKCSEGANSAPKIIPPPAAVVVSPIPPTKMLSPPAPLRKH